MCPGAAPPEVTILGAGIVGIACALEALERGLTVEIIDRAGPGEATSHGNAGVISPWSVVPQCLPGVWKGVPGWLIDPKGPVKLRWRDLPQILPWTVAFVRNTAPARVAAISDAMATLMDGNIEAYRRHLAGTGREDLIVDAMNITVYRGRARPSPDDPALRLRAERGARVEIIGAGDLRDLEPAISPKYHSAALILDQARARDPGLLCRVLAEKATRRGASFRRAEIRAVTPQSDGSLMLETAEGPVSARRLVLAAGVWSARLLRPLGLRLPLIAERGYHLEFPDPGLTLANSVQDAAGKVIASTMEGGLRIAGTAEFADIDAPPNYARARALAPLARRLLPGLRTGEAREWMGSRPSFPDNLPAIGPIEGHPAILAAFGHSHYGLGMAPGTGRMIADWLTTVPNADTSAISPQRFSRG